MAMTQIDQERLNRLHELRASKVAWRLAYPHTHPELRDPHLRSILANELWVLRRRMQEMKSGGYPMDKDTAYGIRLGLETFARRVQEVAKQGMETVYAENFKTGKLAP